MRTFGDDIAVVRLSFLADLARPADVVRTFVPGVVEASGRGRSRTMLSTLRTARDDVPRRATCEVASRAARRLGLGDDVTAALAHVTTAWNGTGYPPVAGEHIPLATRIMHVAGTLVLLTLAAGPEAALEGLRRRAGTQLDPDLAAAAEASLTEGLAAGPGDETSADPQQLVLDAEPDPVRWVDGTGLARSAQTFGDLVDLKSPWLHGHSSAVAALAARAATNLPGVDGEALRLAGHLHDLGRIAVSARIWTKAGPLTVAERDQAHLHPYYTERILTRAPDLARIATMAAQHHERSDGTGYHRGLRAGDLSMPARVLAAADRYQSLVEERPWRKPFTPSTAAADLRSEARAGSLDPDAVAAVLRAAGEQATTLPARPAGLTARQIEVLRLLTRGLKNREIAERLAISPRTAEHHVQDIYLRIGVSTRAAAALYAMEHGLLEGSADRSA